MIAPRQARALAPERFPSMVRRLLAAVRAFPIFLAVPPDSAAEEAGCVYGTLTNRGGFLPNIWVGAFSSTRNGQ